MSDKSLADKAVDIKGKQYVLVSDRVLYFNEHYPLGSIETELLSKPEDPRVVVKATVTVAIVSEKDNKPGGAIFTGYVDHYRKFVGHSQAVVGEGYINKTSALENAETSAVGRALAFMGIGVIDSVASADELQKASQTAKSAPGAKETAKPLDVQFMEKDEQEEVQKSVIKDYMKLLNELATPKNILRLSGIEFKPENFQKIIDALKAKIESTDPLSDTINNK
jgi:hypothetical protein